MSADVNSADPDQIEREEFLAVCTFGAVVGLVAAIIIVAFAVLLGLMIEKTSPPAAPGEAGGDGVLWLEREVA